MNHSSDRLPATPSTGLDERLGAGLPLYQGGGAGAAGVEPTRIADIALVLGRRKLAIALVTVLGVLGAAAISLVQRPVYEATASVEVADLNQDFLSLKDAHATVDAGGSSPEGSLTTEVETLKEDALLERVVAGLGLERREEFIGRPGALQRATERLGLRSAEDAPVRDLPAAGVLRRNMSVEAPRQGRLLRIRYQAPEPVLAADVANALAQALIQQRLEARWGTTELVSKWLNPQLDELRRQLAGSENRLQDYARGHGLLVTDSGLKPGEQNLRLLQEELARARADRFVKQSLNQVALAGGVAVGGDEGRVLQENQIRITELRRELAELSAVLRPENYKVQRVQAQIAELENAQREERARIAQRLQHDHDAAAAREDLLARAYSRQAQLVSDESLKSSQYETLRREVEVNRRVYEAMLQKVKEAGIASAIRPSNIRVISPAKPPSDPVKPNLPLNLAIGMFGGFACGLAYVVASAQVDQKLRAPGQAGLYLNLPELGAIPRAPRGALTGRRRGADGSVALEIVQRNPRPSLFAESFRATLASLQFHRGRGLSPASFVVTSPMPAEGKTTVVTNLGISLAETGRRVLLVDGDWRRPQLHKAFFLENELGLADLLSREDFRDPVTLRQAIQSTGIQNLDVLTSGSAGEGLAARLHGPAVEALFERLREEYDHVIVDAPPSLLFADARLLARATDGVVLVLRADRTNWHSAAAAAQRLQVDGVPILGAVLNDWKPSAGADTYGYGNFKKYYSA